MLKFGGWDWGPRPFRFNNIWLDNKKLKGLMEDWWRNSGCSGWMGYVLKEKLKSLKFSLKEWHKVEYGGMKGRLENLAEDIAELDIKGEAGLLTGVEVQRRKDLFGELWRILKAKNALTVQRSRSKWLREGDANSKYFHKCEKLRSSKNMIKALRVDDGWVESPHEVRKEVVDVTASLLFNYFS